MSRLKESEISLENLEREVNGLGEFIENISSELENVLIRFDRVSRMVDHLKKQKEKADEAKED